MMDLLALGGHGGLFHQDIRPESKDPAGRGLGGGVGQPVIP
jgi:hypothetical protein